MSYQRITGPLMSNSHPGSYCGQDAYNDMLVVDEYEDGVRSATHRSVRGGYTASTLMHRDYKDGKDLVVDEMEGKKYVVRRLTPLECGRLQGFPDNWCGGVPGSDSAQYKMWGNGMALPCMLFVLQSIRDYVRGDSNEDPSGD